MFNHVHFFAHSSFSRCSISLKLSSNHTFPSTSNICKAMTNLYLPQVDFLSHTYIYIFKPHPHRIKYETIFHSAMHTIRQSDNIYIYIFAYHISIQNIFRPETLTYVAVMVIHRQPNRAQWHSVVCTSLKLCTYM